MPRFFVLLFYCATASTAFGQPNLGLPDIVNYTKQVYRGGAQTRMLAQDSSGLMYFANDEGLIRFDGVRWQNFPLPNKSLVRSVAFGPDGNLYVGGQDEVGYFEKNERGGLRFVSLRQTLPEALRSFADVWEIAFEGNDLLLQTSTTIYHRRSSGWKAYPDEYWRFMGKLGTRLIAHSTSRGMLQLEENAWVPLPGMRQTQLPPDLQPTATTAIGRDSFLLATLRHGLYLITPDSAEPWKNADPVLQRSNISSLRRVNENQVAVGTALSGLFIVDLKGKVVRHFSTADGMQDNNILSVFLDSHKNLWLGLRNGIDFIPYNNAITHLAAGALGNAVGYSSARWGNRFYFATSAGLLMSPPLEQTDGRNGGQELITLPGTVGDAWNLSAIGDRLFLGHHEGAFEVKGDKVTAIDRSGGYWGFVPIDAGGRLAAGTYRGIRFLQPASESYTTASREVVVESARFVANAYGRIWISHPYKGIFSVPLSAGGYRYRQYGPESGVHSINDNYLFPVRGQLLLTSTRGVFHYNPTADKFEPDSFYNRHLPRQPIRYLKEDAEGNVWFVVHKQVGLLDVSGSKPSLIYFPELTNKFVAGFEHINPLDTANVLIGGEKGFYHINYHAYRQLQIPLRVFITQVNAISKTDTLELGAYASRVQHGILALTEAGNLPKHFRSLRFAFAAPVYGQLPNIEYSYYLEGFDEGWSAYGTQAEKEYTNLPPGRYTFRVKARNNLGNESAVAAFTLKLLPPWYLSWWAYTLYFLLLALAAYGAYYYERRRFEKQQARHEEEQEKLQYLHRLEMESAEKELVELRNSRLEAELMAKNTELASAALHLVQKSDVLQKVKEQMSKLKDAGPAMESAADLKKILKTLNEEHRIDEEWQHFSQHFDVVHRNFLTVLKRAHPTLTPNEQKLSAYLKMHLTTKEIAQLMNISPRGVEISRYRLRKKLQVPAGVHLSNFLDALEEAG